MRAPRFLRRAAVGTLCLFALVLGFYTLLVVGHWRWLAKQDCRATVLMFHSIVPDSFPAARYWMQESEFARQLEELRMVGARSRPLDEVVKSLERPTDGCPFVENEVVLTFDLDGSSYHRRTAVPHLLKSGFHGVFFVPTGFIDRRSTVSSEDIRAMAKAGIIFGSHTERHNDMRQVPPELLVASLRRSRESLHELTGQQVLAIAAPGGRYDETALRASNEAGFSAFFNSDPCYLGPDDSPFRICRIEIRGDEGMTSAEAMTSPWKVARQATSWMIKMQVESMIGPNGYRKLNRLRRAFEGPGS